LLLQAEFTLILKVKETANDLFYFEVIVQFVIGRRRRFITLYFCNLYYVMHLLGILLPWSRTSILRDVSM